MSMDVWLGVNISLKWPNLLLGLRILYALVLSFGVRDADTWVSELEMELHSAKEGLALPKKVRLVKALVLWELDYKESWALKNWCFWTVVLEKTFESSLDC